MIREKMKNALEDTLRGYIGENVDTSEYSDLQEEIKSAGFWQKWENVENELKVIIRKLGHFPSHRELEELGKRNIYRAMNDYHGGLSKCAKKLGFNFNTKKRKKGLRREEADEKVGGLENYFHKEYEENRRSLPYLSKELGASTSSIRDWLSFYEIKTRNISEAQLPLGFKKPTKKELKEMYYGKNMSSSEIGKLLRVNGATIIAWMKDYGIEIRKGTEAKLKGAIKKPSKNKLEEMYIKKRMSAFEIAEIYRVHDGTIRHWLKNYGIEVRDNSDSHIEDSIKIPSKKELYRMYWERNMSPKKIGEKFGVDAHNVRYWLKKHKIRKKTMSEAFLPTGFKTPSKKKLENLYLNKEMSFRKIGKMFGVSSNFVRTMITDYEIPLRKREPIFSKNELYSMYVIQGKNSHEIAKKYEITPTTVLRYLDVYKIKRRSISETKLPSGFKKPSKKELKEMYVKEGKTTVEIGEKLGVSNVCIGVWLEGYGIKRRDKRNMYDNKEKRKKTANEFIKKTEKNPKDIILKDFYNTKKEDGKGYLGLLQWYRRNYNCGYTEARNRLAEEFYGVSAREMPKPKKKSGIPLKSLEVWDNFYNELKKILKKHPELKGKIPASRWFVDNKYSFISSHAKFHGGFPDIRQKLKQEVLRKPNGYWKDFDNIKKALEKIISENNELNGELPSSTWLNNNGYTDIMNGMNRYHRGYKLFCQKYQDGIEVSANHQLESLLESYAERD